MHEATQPIPVIPQEPQASPVPSAEANTVPPVEPQAMEVHVEQPQGSSADLPEQLIPKTSPWVQRIKLWRYRFETWYAQSDAANNIVRALGVYKRLMRLDRPIGAYLLLWPCLWALWLSSNGHPDEKVFTVFVLGVFLTRSAGCVINDFADRNFDAHVKRTRDRPMATGEVSVPEALALFAALALIAFGLVLTLDKKVVEMSFAGVALMATYPFFKRFFPAPQFYMGLAFSWSIPMAFVAQTGTTSTLCWLLFAATILWAAAYDTIYAMMDRDDDMRIGIRSSAILFGDADRVIIGIMQIMALYALWLAGSKLELGNWYKLGLGVAALLSLFQQFLIRKRTPADCMKAFLNNNYFGMAVFIGIALEYLFHK
ncbi:MAG TPA: 4-hydroxybenzoate octaprenyltransferase [Steroidobacteraceae bacterium]|nr:4-hydroxybenzoate octaprenyltransferase [Steroidobacteraceae bacterium]